MQQESCAMDSPVKQYQGFKRHRFKLIDSRKNREHDSEGISDGISRQSRIQGSRTRRIMKDRRDKRDRRDRRGTLTRGRQNDSRAQKIREQRNHRP